MTAASFQKLKELLSDKSNSLPAFPARLLNGRGGKAPGFADLNIDFYPPLIFATIYCKYSDAEIAEMTSVLNELFSGCPILIQDRSIRPAVTRLSEGDIPDEMIIAEAGLKFFLHPFRGQNPGFFPDMRTGRELIRERVALMKTADGGSTEIAEITVLNLFAYTCALSAVALSAGASRVVNIDKNRRSLDIGKRNHRLNHDRIPGGYNGQAKFLPHDIFKSIGKLKKEGPYNIIIADPPPSQKGSFLMLKDYPRLLRRLPEMLKPGGLLMLTQNSPGWSWEDFETMIIENLPDFTELRRIQPPEDFAPVEDGRGLKIIIANRC
ncbi:MAG TPA: SAM-dependent methyltransferase [Spirochaeta sp.]|nr:SAM-dependent methyltransferase [Spirochaeta sp.]